jgi:hypothetical protein
VRERRNRHENFFPARMCVWLEGKLFLKPPIEFAVGKELAEGIYAGAGERVCVSVCGSVALSALESLGPMRVMMIFSNFLTRFVTAGLAS